MNCRVRSSSFSGHTAGLVRQAKALDRRVRIVNEFEARHRRASTGRTSACGTGRKACSAQNHLAAGASVVLNFEDDSGYCRYRFRAVFDDGVELVRPSVNVCEVGTYRYTD